MKVVHAITGLGIGGAENLLFDVAQEMAARGIAQQVIYYTPRSVLVPKFEAIGIKPLLIDEMETGFLGAIRRTRRVICDAKPDILHTHLPRADIVGRAAGLSVPNIPCFSTIHNRDVWRGEKSPMSLFLAAFDKATINHSRRAHLIAVSESSRAWCMEKTHIRPDKITTCPNFATERSERRGEGVSRAALGIGEKDLVLVNAARMVPEKEQIDIVRCAALLRAQGVTDIKFLILGDGEERGALEEAIRDGGLQGQVILMGFQQNVYDYYSISDAYLLPSSREGFPVSLLEAARSGLGTIAADIPAMQDIKKGSEGIILYPLHDITTLSQILLRARADRRILVSLAEAGRAFEAQFTVTGYVDRLLALYGKRLAID
ncbi:MAG: glycosyltransferase [Oscillospiraceae bacterium]|jgi:glycosyltransferase involved in cell wall biosynthesis|nr:glycosyltransferase [Oscillospiraceae bacterium]